MMQRSEPYTENYKVALAQIKAARDGLKILQPQIDAMESTAAGVDEVSALNKIKNQRDDLIESIKNLEETLDTAGKRQSEE